MAGTEVGLLFTTQQENHVSTKDKASNKAQDVKGKVKETARLISGNEELEGKGKADQAKSAVKDVGENIKDAGRKLKDAVTGK